MSELIENPELMLELLAKLVALNGGYVRLTGDDEPAGAFNLSSRVDFSAGAVELKLENFYAGTA